MTTKTRGGMIPTLIVIAIVVAAMTIGGGWDMIPGSPRTDKEELIVLSVRFTPSPSDKGVAVLAHTEGVRAVDAVAATSPWTSEPFWIPKGAEVSMMASQQANGMVTCHIYANGKLVATGITKDPLSSARCWYNRKPVGPRN